MNSVPSLESFLFQKEDYRLIGGFYKSGQDNASTAILIHGIPGIEKYTDFAYQFQSKGWNCLYFHYRGSWGSTGNYNIATQLDDISEAIKWTKNQASVDSEKIVLIGASLGGYNTLAAAAKLERLRAYVALCPLIDVNNCDVPEQNIKEFADFLSGVSRDQIFEQWNNLNSICDYADRLKDKKILIITGDQDEVFPPSHYNEIVERVPTIDWIRHKNSDHSFSGNHKWLFNSIYDYLSQIQKSHIDR